jgi:CDP-diacylglycerol--glycerol-3-phosphate 3-phosphatidyltransferase
MKFKMNVPNALTMVRIFCTPLLILMFLLPIPKGIGVFISLGIYILACITDFLDGYIARKYNLITDFGKFMDQIADKFLTTTAMFLVLFGRAAVTANWLAVLMFLIVVLRDILISGIRMIAANNNIVIAADIFGKVKSFFLDVASMVLILFVGLREVVSCDFLRYVQVFGLSLMIIGVVLTIVSCVNYTISAIKALTKEEVELASSDEEE